MSIELLVKECNKLYKELNCYNSLDYLKKNEIDKLLELRNKNFYNREYIELPFIEFVVTTKCNLLCQGCSNLIPLYKDKMKDMSFEDFVIKFDLLINAVDFLYVLKIHGGEPFFNEDIVNIVKYANKNKKIGKIIIPTNGTYIPKEDILKEISILNKVEVFISSYEINKEKVKELKDVLISYNIKYKIIKEKEWYDLNDIDFKNDTYEQLVYKKKKCLMGRFLSYVNNKIYLCSRAGNAVDLNLISEKERDSCLLNGKEDKQKIFNFIEKDCFDYCGYCLGAFERTMKSGRQE